ncbi:MAG: hypothetical protein NVS2B16_15560 [Chloroflexota bacterium]
MRLFSMKGWSPIARAATAILSGVALVSVDQASASAARHSDVFRGLSVSRQFATAYTPAEIAAAYDFTPLYASNIDATGQTVALIEIGHANPSDLQQFDQQFNLRAPKIKEYYAGGKAFKTRSDGETALDIEWLHALAPGARIQVYYMKSRQVNQSGWKQMASLIRSAASNGAGTISISIGTCGTSPGYTATKSALAAVRKQGVSVFVASGDFGDHPGPTSDCGRSVGVGYPSSDPSVVAVGGTSLQLNDDNTIASEVAWALSGGGLVSKFLRPAWQTAPGLPPGTSRGVPDVAFLADPATGVAIYYNGRWRQGGGTSLGAPSWAAAWSLVRQSVQQNGLTVHAAPSLLYSIANSSTYHDVFHTITSGSNGQYSAGPDWNPVTGLGTPDVAKLVAQVGAKS